MLGHHLIKALLRGHVLEVDDVADLLIYREDLLGFEVDVTERIIELLYVLGLSAPILILKDHPLILAQMLNLVLDSLLNQTLSLVQTLNQSVIGISKLCARQALQLSNGIRIAKGV